MNSVSNYSSVPMAFNTSWRKYAEIATHHHLLTSPLMSKRRMAAATTVPWPSPSSLPSEPSALSMLTEMVGACSTVCYGRHMRTTLHPPQTSYVAT